MATRKKKAKKRKANRAAGRPSGRQPEPQAPSAIVLVQEEPEIHPNAASSPSITQAEAGVLLGLAPAIFCRASVSAAIAAILFTYIRAKKLYEGLGFEAMRPYAAEKLRVETDDDYKKTARSGNAFWQYMPDRCLQIVRDILTLGEVTAVTPLPSKTAMAVLPRVLRKTPKADRETLVRRVVEGECSSADLERMAKESGGKTRRRTPAQPGTGGSEETGLPADPLELTPSGGQGAVDVVVAESETATAERHERTIVESLRPFFPNTSERVFGWAVDHAGAGQQEALVGIAIIASHEKLKLLSWLTEHDTRFTSIGARVRGVLDTFDSLGTGKQAAQLLRRVEAIEGKLIDIAGKAPADRGP